MFKRLGVFGLLLVSATTVMMQPVAAFGQDGYGYRDGNAYHQRDDRRFREGRGYNRDDRGWEWREREARAQAWREHEWRERQRWQNREFRYNYSPNYFGNPNYARPY